MGQSRRIRLELNPPQSTAFRLLGTGQTVCTPWGRGVGKGWFQRQTTWLDVAKWDGVQRDGHKSGIRVVALMDELKHFKAVHGNLLERELDEEWGCLGAEIDKQNLRVTFPGGSWFQPFAAADHRSRVGRGLRCDKIILDECDDIDLSVYQAVAIPWFSEPFSLKMRLAGGTPIKGRHGLLHHLHQLGLSKDPQHSHFHTVFATHKDAPKTVDPKAVEEARATMPKAIFEREWECNFDAAEGLVYDGFDESFHVREPFEGAVFTEHLFGVDFGYTDPGVFIHAGVLGHGEDAVVWILDELYETGQVIDYWAEKARRFGEKHPRAIWYADPSRPDSIKTIRQKAQVNIRPAANSIDEGVDAVAARLVKRGDEGHKWARLYVHPRCKNTIREFGAYRRKRDPQNRDSYLEAIEDKNNHAQDSIRYLIFNRFGKAQRTRTEWT